MSLAASGTLEANEYLTPSTASELQTLESDSISRKTFSQRRDFQNLNYDSISTKTSSIELNGQSKQVEEEVFKPLLSMATQNEYSNANSASQSNTVFASNQILNLGPLKQRNVAVKNTSASIFKPQQVEATSSAKLSVATSQPPQRMRLSEDDESVFHLTFH